MLIYRGESGNLDHRFNWTTRLSLFVMIRNGSNLVKYVLCMLITSLEYTDTCLSFIAWSINALYKIRGFYVIFHTFLISNNIKNINCTRIWPILIFVDNLVQIWIMLVFKTKLCCCWVSKEFFVILLFS